MMKEIPTPDEGWDEEGPFVLTYTDRGFGGPGAGNLRRHAKIAYYFENVDAARDWIYKNTRKFGRNYKYDIFPVRLPVIT